MRFFLRSHLQLLFSHWPSSFFRLFRHFFTSVPSFFSLPFALFQERNKRKRWGGGGQRYRERKSERNREKEKVRERLSLYLISHFSLGYDCLAFLFAFRASYCLLVVVILFIRGMPPLTAVWMVFVLWFFHSNIVKCVRTNKLYSHLVYCEHKKMSTEWMLNAFSGLWLPFRRVCNMFM